MNKYTIETFISKANLVHNNKYDYSKVKYVDHKTEVLITCPIHGDFLQKPTLHLQGHGCVHCNTSRIKKKVLYDMAIVDVGYTQSKETKKSYAIWKDMLSRCYNPHMLKRFPTYIGCSVCKEWLIFSNFKSWFDKNYKDGYDLDKDILVKGNKIYSPETCCFVPHKLNCTITRCQKSRGNLPIGVCFDKTRKKYASGLRVGMTKKNLGRFDTPIEAFLAYKEAKEKYVKELAESYFQNEHINEKVYRSLMRYEVEITD